MKIIRLLLLFPILLISEETRVPDLIPSSPERIAEISSGDLIGGLINPISGHVSYQVTDLVAPGAQPVTLTRTYSAPGGSFDGDWSLYSHLAQNPQWIYWPDYYLEANGDQNNGSVKYRHTNGAVLDFRIREGKTELISTYGIHNASGDFPSGRNDLRNIKITFDPRQQVQVALPDGTKRIYHFNNSVYPRKFYFLSEIALPNGKVICCDTDYLGILSMQSCDRQKQHQYASISRSRSLSERFSYETFFNHLGQSATYTLSRFEAPAKINKGTHTFRLKLLTSVSSPSNRNEILHYPKRYLLGEVYGKEDQFSFHLTPSCSNVYQLSLPVGEQDSFSTLYTIAYSPATAGVNKGRTKVDHSDGTATVYIVRPDFLIESISRYDDSRELRCRKIYQWTENQYLASIEYQDTNTGQSENPRFIADRKKPRLRPLTDLPLKTVYRREFSQYDSFGNAQIETFSGDLTGSGEWASYQTKRKYSQDGLNLLLREENNEGLITTYSYLPNTNLITKKLTLTAEKILIREFYSYDDCCNLILQMTDDGTSEEAEDLTGVTQRTFKAYTLRQEAPYLHMPAVIEEGYFNGEQKVVLKTTKLSYDDKGNVNQEEIFGSDGKLAYSLNRELDEQGNILWETDPLGYKTTYTYDARGRCTSIGGPNGLTTIRTIDAKGRLKELKESTSDHSHTSFYEYDSFDRLKKKTDPFENAFIYEEYDLIANQPILAKQPKTETPENGSQQATQKTTYDAGGHCLTKEDPRGNITRTTYNAYGSPVQITYPDGTFEEFRYYPNGKLASYQDQNQNLITYQYDALERITQKTYCLKDQPIASELYEYDSFHLKSFTDKERRKTT